MAWRENAQVMFPNVETMFRSDIETMKGFCALAQPEHLVMLKEVSLFFCCCRIVTAVVYVLVVVHM